jgi:GH25 family lysozyme M1 (1,4-beta-N-acetylmuramidase)|nr:MAG TPA: hypothetical protein [Caudoviricetes sp.]
MSLFGVDISSHQGNIDLSALTIDFCIVKATEGTTYLNPFFHSKMEQAKSLGLLTGVYHFANGRTSGLQEADWFLANIGNYVGNSILILDWEDDAVERGASYAYEFMKRIEEKTGVKPMLYTGRYVIEQFDFSKIVQADYGLWLATLDGSEYHTYMEFPLVAMVQTWARPISGYPRPIDNNVFYGSRETWKKYCGNRKVEAETKPNTPIYKVGDKVRFSTCYKSSTDDISKHIKASKMLRNTGTITKIVEGAKNPYLLDNGLCWVNAGDIREVL